MRPQAEPSQDRIRRGVQGRPTRRSRHDQSEDEDQSGHSEPERPSTPRAFSPYGSVPMDREAPCRPEGQCGQTTQHQNELEPSENGMSQGGRSQESPHGDEGHGSSPSEPLGPEDEGRHEHGREGQRGVEAGHQLGDEGAGEDRSQDETPPVWPQDRLHQGRRRQSNRSGQDQPDGFHDGFDRDVHDRRQRRQKGHRRRPGPGAGRMQPERGCSSRPPDVGLGIRPRRDVDAFDREQHCVEEDEDQAEQAGQDDSLWDPGRVRRGAFRQVGHGGNHISGATPDRGSRSGLV